MKTSLSAFWISINTRFEALNQRERWLVSGAIIVVIYAALNMLLLEPALAHKKTLANAISTDQAQLDALNQQISQLTQQAIIDPDAQNKQRIAALQSSLRSLDNQLSHLQTTLVNPDKMPELLRSLLQKNGKLKLIALDTLPSTGLLEAMPDDQENPEQSAQSHENIRAKALSEPYVAPVFKHGVEITVEGNYLDLLAYVSALEKMPWHVLWSKASLNADTVSPPQWPANRLKLTVYTLSLDQTWLSI